jgi:hypothetical protein
MGVEAVGNLRAFLGLDSAEFETGLKKSAKSGGKFALDLNKGMGSALKDIESRLYGTSRSAGVAGNALAGAGLAGAAAGAAIVAAFTGARSAMMFADDISDVANRFKVTTDYLQEQRFIVHALGGDYKDADKALEGFQSAFGAARAGLTAKAVKPFTALGLDPKNFGSVQEALIAVTNKVANLKNAAEQAAIADKLGLSAMLPALREGSAAMEDLRQKAHDLGYVMDAELIEKAGSANDKFEDLTAILDVQFKSAMVSAVPLIMSVTGALVDGVEAASNFAEQLASVSDWLGKFSKTTLSGEVVQTDRERLFGQMMNPGKAGGGRSNVNMARQGQVKAPAALQVSAQAMQAMFGVPKTEPKGTLNATGGGGKDKSAQIAAASAEAIAQASKDELAARMALTGDIAKLGALRLAEIGAETKRETERLSAAAKDKKITAAAAQTAITSIEAAAVSKRLLASRETEEQLASAALGREQDTARIRDQIASIDASFARSATERNNIEMAQLSARQAMDRKVQNQDLAQQVSRGEITEALAFEAKFATQALQIAQRREQEQKAAAAVEAEANTRAESALEIQIDGLAIQADQAKTSAERRDLDARILELQQELERLKLQEVIASAQSTDLEKSIARSRLAMLDATKKSAKEKSVEVMEGAFADAGNAVDDMVRAFESNDWNGAFKGVMEAVKAVEIAFGKGGLEGKIGAVAGIVSAIGSALGGSTGSALSGAASGAMMGMQLGGPVGAAVGAVAGGLASLFGSSKAKKKAKKAAAAQAAADAAAAAKAEADQIRALEIAKMRAGGNEAGATAAEQSDILAGMSAAAQALQKEVWALEAASEAAVDAAEHAAKIRTLEIALMRATGDAAGAELAEREDLLKTMSETEQQLQRQVWAQEDLAAAAKEAADALSEATDRAMSGIETARDDVAAAYDREASALEQRSQDLKSFAENIRAFMGGLEDGLSTTQSYAEAQARFSKTLGAASLGDPGAQADFQSAAESFLGASKDNAQTREDYLRDIAKVKAGSDKVASVAERNATIADQQLAELTKQVAGILGVNESVQSVEAAIAALTRAFGNYTAVSGQQLGANPSANAALAAATGYRGDFGTGGFQAWIEQQDESTKAIARRVLTQFGQTQRIGFKTGGSFKVGGFGGTDSQLTQINTSPGEMINVSKRDVMDDAASGIDALLVEFQALNRRQEQVIVNTGSMARQLATFKKNGLYVRGEDPDLPLPVSVSA